MRLLLLLFSITYTVTSYTQEKIKTEVNSRGDTVYLTGDKKIYTSPGARNAIGEILKSSVYKFGSGLSLCLSIQTGRTSVFTISEGDAAEIFFKDGTSLALRSNGDHSSRRSALDYGCYLFVFYSLNSDALTKLRTQDIEKINVFASLGKMVYEIKDKQSDAVRKQVVSFKEE